MSDTGGTMFWRIKKKGKQYYLYREWYDPETRKRRSKSLGNVELIDRLLQVIEEQGLTIESAIQLLSGGWCGGWDLNPRRPTPAGPQPAPFVLARAPPHLHKNSYPRVEIFNSPSGKILPRQVFSLGARSLAWIGRRPPKPVVRGSNPRGPATYLKP